MRNIPYTLVPLIIFNLVIAFADPRLAVDGVTVNAIWDDRLLTLTLFSGVEWTLHVGDLMVLVGLLALMGEVFRATSMARNAVTNHLLSIIVLIVFVIEFVVVGEAANSTFFILTLVALIDVLTGVVVTIRLATRDVAFAERYREPRE